MSSRSSTRSRARASTRGSRSCVPSPRRARYEPTTALVGVATQGGRFPPAWRALLKDCIRDGLDVENGLHEFISTDPELVALAREHGAELRDLRMPPPGLERPDRREPDARRDDGPHGRIGLRDREDDGRRSSSTARHGGAAGEASSSRPDRRGSRSPAGGSPSTPSSRTSSPAPRSSSCSKVSSVGARCSSSRGRARCCTPATPASRSG